MVEYNINTEGKAIVAAFPSQVSGRTFLITGPSQGGVGAETAISLADASPSTLILLGRDLTKIQPTIDAIKAINSSILVKYIPVDLASLTSVRAVAIAILDDSTIPKIDVMINNGAIMAAPYSLTTDGYESHFQINYLSHFLLTNLLLPKLLMASPPARILNVSSAGHSVSDVRYESTDFEKGTKYVPWFAYGQSKTACILFSVELNRRFKESGCKVRAFSPTPGAVDTGLQRFVTKEMREEGMKVWIASGKAAPVRKSLQQGCATYLRASLDPALVDQDLVFLSDCVPTDNPEELSAYAVDAENAKKCWALSEEMVGEKFDLKL
ncbi:NAD(P)-binding protein [Mollisia scopiformis]|uniref:NAD(P)-binding protein n=1 Tax=Mollisia scopiformis TaxID=149040 RepID=A0A194X3C7_MOLSC|nr:NAD(P)-binding protein [Mollisia scopiformis]KUJ14529.1 NAD(P)-binding protein [Mollisia scopiformis]